MHTTWNLSGENTDMNIIESSLLKNQIVFKKVYKRFNIKEIIDFEASKIKFKCTLYFVDWKFNARNNMMQCDKKIFDQMDFKF